ncbi:MAG: hypothetical protein ACRCYS_12050, partial [Beijerinckiaceae bacterium]
MGERRVTADGRILEKQADGSIVEVGRAAPQQSTRVAPPVNPYKERQFDREDRNDADARADRDKAYRLQRAKTIADLAEKGQTLDAQDNIVPIPNWVDPKAKKDRLTNLTSLVQQINRTQQLGNAGPLASQSPLSALSDYNPFSSANARFDTAGAQLAQQGLAAFRVPGTGTVSDRDAMMFDRGNLPEASNIDARNQEQLDGLRRRVDAEYDALGLPRPKWVGVPQGGAMDQTFVADPELQAVPPGAQEQDIPLPPGMQEEHAAYMVQHDNGRMDPAAYIQFRRGLDQKY